MTFGWHYPPGSMRGSGIDTQERVMVRMCHAPLEPDHDDENSPEECDFNDAVDVRITDFGVLVWDCPTCGAEHEEEMPDE